MQDENLMMLLLSRKENRKCKEVVLPIFEKFHQWLIKKKKTRVQSGKFGEAVLYSLKYWPLILNYMECAELTPDNNVAENAIRPFVCGRKNWLFSGSEDGARSSCFIYTLIENAKMNNLVPYEYLRCLFEQSLYAKTKEDWEKLLPWNITITPFQKYLGNLIDGYIQ